MLDPLVAAAVWWDGATGGYRPLSTDARQRIRDEMIRLRSLAAVGPLELDCFCSPLPCHGDAIRRLLLEMGTPSPDQRG